MSRSRCGHPGAVHRQAGVPPTERHRGTRRGCTRFRRHRRPSTYQAMGGRGREVGQAGGPDRRRLHLDHGHADFVRLFREVGGGDKPGAVRHGRCAGAPTSTRRARRRTGCGATRRCPGTGAVAAAAAPLRAGLPARHRGHDQRAVRPGPAGAPEGHRRRRPTRSTSTRSARIRRVSSTSTPTTCCRACGAHEAMAVTSFPSRSPGGSRCRRRARWTRRSCGTPSPPGWTVRSASTRAPARRMPTMAPTTARRPSA